jgi:formyl-CoA transferase
MSATPTRCELAPPTLGQHTDEVLREVLDLDPARLQSLRSQGVI